MITLDGDFHMLYYRTDVLEAAGKKPPTTWDEYLDVAKAVGAGLSNAEIAAALANAAAGTATYTESGRG